jgi:hypothetical protein
MENQSENFEDLSVFNYIIENYHKFILLILVFLIIYFVDYISNINAIIYSSPQIPMVTNNGTNNINKDIKKSKKNIKKSKNKKT